jgi:hypothetical protein
LIKWENIHCLYLPFKFAKIILARTYFESGEYEKAIEIIGQLSFDKEHVSQGYGLVLFLQARVIKGL